MVSTMQDLDAHGYRHVKEQPNGNTTVVSNTLGTSALINKKKLLKDFQFLTKHGLWRH